MRTACAATSASGGTSASARPSSASSGSGRAPAEPALLGACRVLAERTRGRLDVSRVELGQLVAIELLDRPPRERGETERLCVQRLLEDRARVARVPEPLAAAGAV